METCLKLHYPHYPQEVDSKMLLQEYFSQHVPYSTFKETTINMMRCFHKAFSSGLVSGKTLIDISFMPIITHLLAMCEFLEDILILEANGNDASIEALVLWRNKDPDAFDWSNTSKLFMELKGMSSDKAAHEEEGLRGKIEQILKWDLGEHNSEAVLSLPKADCVTSIGSLETISKLNEDYRRNLRKISNLIKLGGHFLVYAPINASYFKVGEEKFHCLSCDESFYRKVLSEEGFEIKHCEKFDKIMCSDTMDHEEMVFIIAHKVKEPEIGEMSSP